jgi:hypothetical protein
MIDADRLIARIMRLSAGRMLAQWTAGGLIKLIEEEVANCQFCVIENREKSDTIVS